MNTQMMMFQQIMKAPNKVAIVENLIKQNPQMNNAWRMAQQLSQNGNKDEVLNQIAMQRGININELKQFAKNFGINI